MRKDIERLDRQKWLLRIVFMLMILVSCLLLIYQLTDYIILLLLVLLPVGFITLDKVIIEYDIVNINKYYLFGCLPKHYTIEIDAIKSIKAINLEIEPDNEAYSEELFSGLFIIFISPKYRRVLYNLVYKENNTEKTLRINLSTEGYKEIDEKMRKFNQFYC